mmetsp:Transcript_12282/g.45717  ORF Transcript_12282/g.45717 Transcript_12282/m.45717 type:complete len:286 (+) Transcript_12282:2360-3217(+)
MCRSELHRYRCGLVSPNPPKRAERGENAFVVEARRFRHDGRVGFVFHKQTSRTPGADRDNPEIHHERFFAAVEATVFFETHASWGVYGVLGACFFGSLGSFVECIFRSFLRRASIRVFGESVSYCSPVRLSKRFFRKKLRKPQHRYRRDVRRRAHLQVLREGSGFFRLVFFFFGVTVRVTGVLVRVLVVSALERTRGVAQEVRVFREKREAENLGKRVVARIVFFVVPFFVPFSRVIIIPFTRVIFLPFPRRVLILPFPRRIIATIRIPLRRAKLHAHAFPFPRL